MPLLHQEDSRGGGGTSENRRSLAEFRRLDTTQLGEPAPAAPNHRPNRGAFRARWDKPSSPEAAHTPRSFVPAACFPPRHPTAFASYSESARPGGWADDSGQGITDLVSSLKALAMPAANARPSQQMRRSLDAIENKAERPWLPEQASGAPGRDERLLLRRASFCGAVGAAGVAGTADAEAGWRGAESGWRGAEAGWRGPETGWRGPEAGWRGAGAPAHWGGVLPARCTDPSGSFSPKLFLGGLPWDITEHALLHTLRQFQPISVEWPGRECADPSGGGGAGGAGAESPRGYAYVTFESERRVRALLAASRRKGNEWYYRVSSRKIRSKDVQVIPWAVSDSNWVCGGSARLEPARTVFVGGLHGMLSASALAHIMNDLFSGVVYAGIDTDKNKYPIGSGRVTFNNVRSYVRAISAAYVEIETDKFTKKVQVNPYLEDSMCSMCNLQQGPYFCREPVCFRYFCRLCWMCVHPAEEHEPLMRNSKSVCLLPRRAPHHCAPAYRAPDHYVPAYRAPDHYPPAYRPPGEGTPSPPTSGTSGTSGASGTSATSDLEPVPGGDEPIEAAWPPH